MFLIAILVKIKVLKIKLEPFSIAPIYFYWSLEINLIMKGFLKTVNIHCSKS